MIHSMQAAVITGPGQAGLTEIPIPDPGSGDLLIRSKDAAYARPTFPCGREGHGSPIPRHPVIRGMKVGERSKPPATASRVLPKVTG